jgi:asparagine synthase (glutamine-hydrolysing)
MAEFLPAEIQWRVPKTDFLASFSYGFLVRDRERLDAVVRSDLDLIQDYVDVLALRRLYEHVSRPNSRKTLPDMLAIWRAVSLALWLRRIREKGGAYESA